MLFKCLGAEVKPVLLGSVIVDKAGKDRLIACSLVKVIGVRFGFPLTFGGSTIFIGIRHLLPSFRLCFLMGRMLCGSGILLDVFV